MTQKKATIGIDLGATEIKYGISDKAGNVLASQSRSCPSKGGPSAVLLELSTAAGELLQFARNHEMEITSIGIGSPGGIDIENGVVLGTSPNIENWPGTNIKQDIEKTHKLPCFVDNDANMFILAEHLYGAGKGYNHIVGLTLGTGIGTGLILDGQLYRGSRGVGAELGHCPIVVQGRSCKCGLKGCLEAYASTDALIGFYKKRNPKASDDISPKWIFDMAKKGDDVAESAINAWAGCLATGIGIAVNLLNPELVVLGGGISSAGGYLHRKVAVAVKKTALPLTSQNLQLKLAELGNKAGWLGAAAFARVSQEW
jgi:glucokinase